LYLISEAVNVERIYSIKTGITVILAVTISSLHRGDKTGYKVGLARRQVERGSENKTS
jgi:hypothetical protein